MTEDTIRVVDSCSLYKINNDGEVVFARSNVEAYTNLLFDPCIQKNINPKDAKYATHHIFTFTNDVFYYHVYHFNHKSKKYAFMIMTKTRFHTIFYTFYEHIEDDYPSKYATLDINSFFLYVSSLLSFWTLTGNILHIVLSEKEYDQSLEYAPSNTFTWRPSNILPENTNYRNLWETLLSDTPIYVECADPNLLSKTVITISGLTIPIQFKGKIVLKYNVDDTDPSIDEDAKIIGLTKIKNRKHKFIYKIKEVGNSELQMLEWLPCPRKLDELCEHVMIHRLCRDPFCLIRGMGLLTEDVNEYISDESAPLLPSQDILIKFGKSKTLQEWLNNKLYDDSFRNAFLSLDPEVYYQNFSTEELENQLVILDGVTERFKKDKHVCLIVKSHKKRINSLLGK